MRLFVHVDLLIRNLVQLNQRLVNSSNTPYLRYLDFVKKCYLNYDKEIISCAALYLSSKNEYYKKKLSDFLFTYHKNKLTGKAKV